MKVGMAFIGVHILGHLKELTWAIGKVKDLGLLVI